MQTTTPMVPSFSSIPVMLLGQVSGGCDQSQCPQQQPTQQPAQPIQQMLCCPQFNFPQSGQSSPSIGDTSGGSSSGGGDSVSIVINGVPQTGGATQVQR